MDLIKKYFPDLTVQQYKQFHMMLDIYKAWNQKINLVSRKDIEMLEERHILHALAIGKYIRFLPETTVMDFGTGGGFPGLPLAVLFPEVSFTLVDSIQKKIKAVEDIYSQLGLRNVKVVCARGETLNENFDFIVSRAVTALPKFMQWVAGRIKPHANHDKANGVLYLKGGAIDAELTALKQNWRLVPLDVFYSELFFKTKVLVHVY